MTDYQSRQDRDRSNQNAIQRHIWSELRQTDTGSFLTVRATGTYNYEVPVLNTGYGFNLPKNSNAEVFTFADNRDPNRKFALPTIPRDKQRKWGENTGGIQSPVDPDRAVEINEKRTHIHDKDFAIGKNGGVQSDGENTIFRGNVTIEKDLRVKGNIYVGGNVYAGGDCIINGILNANIVRTNDVQPNPERATIIIIIPPFEK